MKHNLESACNLLKKEVYFEDESVNNVLEAAEPSRHQSKSSKLANVPVEIVWECSSLQGNPAGKEAGFMSN